MSAKAPEIRPEYRPRRVRGSISVPQDVDAWVRWKAAHDKTTVSAVYATAVTLWSKQLNGEGGGES